MRNNSLPPTRKILITLLAVLVFSTFAGCAAFFKRVSPENLISLSQDTTSQGVFSYGDLTVQYSYTLDGPTMTVEGRIAFRKSFDSLNVYLLVVDAAGSVIHNSLVYSSGFRTATSRAKDISFTENLVLPDSTAGISFNYGFQDRRSFP